jgi:hypothetical protein
MIFLEELAHGKIVDAPNRVTPILRPFRSATLEIAGFAMT